MVTEIYCKLPTDRDYVNKLETVNEIQQIVQQIRMILGTKPGQVLGSPNFGIDLQKYLFSYNNSQKEIEYLVNGAIAYYIKFDTQKYTVKCEVSFGHEAERPNDYAVIDIVINENKCIGILVSQE